MVCRPQVLSTPKYALVWRHQYVDAKALPKARCELELSPKFNVVESLKDLERFVEVSKGKVCFLSTRTLTNSTSMRRLRTLLVVSVLIDDLYLDLGKLLFDEGRRQL